MAENEISSSNNEAKGDVKQLFRICCGQGAFAKSESKNDLMLS